MNFYMQEGNPQNREFLKQKRRIRWFVFAILLAGVIAFFIIPPVRKAVQGKKEYRMYLEFLEGARSADGWDITEITVPTGEPEKRYFSEYAFFDCDGDGLSELHIRSGKGYYVIDCEKDKLSLWGSFLPQTALLNNGDYLYLHIGGAPLHYDYKYFVVNGAGEEVWSLMFACYDADGDGQFGEGDSYFLEDKSISYEDWLELERTYLEVGADDVLWTTLTEQEDAGSLAGSSEGNRFSRQNPYFYSAAHIVLSADAEYYELETVAEKRVEIEINRIKEYELGELYKLAVKSIDLDSARTNIYLYVTSEKIYRIWAYIVEENGIAEFYDDDETLTEYLDTDRKLVENGEVVCQSEEVSEEDENGKRSAISLAEKSVIYSRCDVQDNGEPGFFEWFIWEQGKGLTEYGSGFGAERDILYLYQIGEQ